MSASNVQVLDRGLDLIERLATAENGMTISELVAETGLPKSTIHRILATFADRHYVEKNEETSVYSLGYKFVELASLYLNKIVLKTEAEPVMHTLAQVLHATTYLGVLENNEVMYLQRTEPRNSLRLYTSIGKREPLYCTALGKVLLASLPLKEFEHVAQHLSYEPYTPNSITNYEDLARDVMLVRKRGYATDRGWSAVMRLMFMRRCVPPHWIFRITWATRKRRFQPDARICNTLRSIDFFRFMSYNIIVPHYGTMFRIFKRSAEHVRFHSNALRRCRVGSGH